MKDYKRVTVECFSYQELMELYKRDYEISYKLIGYRYNTITQIGELVLYERK